MLKVLICSEQLFAQLNRDQETCTKLQTWRDTGLQLVLLSFPWELPDNLPLDQALWLAGTGEEYQCARVQGIACLPYVVGENYGDFPGAKYLLSGEEEDGLYVDLEYLEHVFLREKHLPWTIAETDHFILREFAMEDMDALYDLYSDESLYPFVEPLFERSQEEDYERAYIENMYELLGYGMWLVIDPDTREVIGRAGLETHQYYSEQGCQTGLELGYLLRKDYRGRGLAREICQWIIDYAKREFDYDTLNCLIHADNIASIRLALSLGFGFQEESLEKGKKMNRYVLKLRQN